MINRKLKEDGEMVRIGVIGCGAIAVVEHLPGFAKCRNGRVMAVADIDEKKAVCAAKKFGIKEYYSDYRKMLERDDIDAVSIATPNFLHRDMAVKSAGAGKHILVEKPMASTMKEADEMIKAAKKNKVILMVEQTHRFLPANQKARDLLVKGIIGRVTTTRGRVGHGGPESWSFSGKWFFRKKEAFGGVMADMGIHEIDVMRWMLRKEIKEVSAFMGTLEKKIEVEDNGVCLMKFSDGTFGIMEASWTTRPGVAQTTFYGEKGTMVVNAIGDITVKLASGRTITPKVPSRGNYGTKYGSPYQYFVNCVEKGEKPFVPGEEGRRSLEVVIAAYESNRTGKVVRLPLKRQR